MVQENHEWDSDERSEEPMDKNQFGQLQSLFFGVLFWRACLQAESQARRQEKS